MNKFWFGFVTGALVVAFLIIVSLGAYFAWPVRFVPHSFCPDASQGEIVIGHSMVVERHYLIPFCGEYISSKAID